MDTTQLTQLGIAGVVAFILLYILKLVLDGRLHTDAEIAVRDRQLEASTHRVDDLLSQNKALTSALAASNEQSRAIIALWKELQDEEAHPSSRMEAGDGRSGRDA